MVKGLGPNWDDGKENESYYGREFIGLGFKGFLAPIMENQLEKNKEHEMETGIMKDLGSRVWFSVWLRVSNLRLRI